MKWLRLLLAATVLLGITAISNADYILIRYSIGGKKSDPNNPNFPGGPGSMPPGGGFPGGPGGPPGGVSGLANSSGWFVPGLALAVRPRTRMV